MKLRPAHLIDFYKSGHIRQYEPGTTLVYSNWTARSGKHFQIPGVKKYVHFGVQGLVKWLFMDLWNKEFFEAPLKDILDDYSRRMDNGLGPGLVSVDHIKALHELGYLPLHIKSLPEGSMVPFNVPAVTVGSTHRDFFWLTNYVEDMLSCESWKPSTLATITYEFRKMIQRFAEETGVPLDFCNWQLHDFSFRGMSGVHDAASSNSGHLVSSLGTDTIPAMDYLDDYYSGRDTFLGGSVPATEHSVMCMGSKEAEIDTFRRIITELYPSGVVSIVSDTWDYWNIINVVAPTLAPEILARTPNAIGLAKTVFRPDSGDPVEIICGNIEVIDLGNDEAHDGNFTRRAINILSAMVVESTPHGECGVSTIEGYFTCGDKVFKALVSIEWNCHDKQYYYLDGASMSSFEETTLTPEQKGTVELLWDHFGGTINDAGYKVLNERVGTIYGDSITYDRASRILAGLKAKGFASSNIVFGIGSYTYQYNTRDSLGFAMKATYGEVNGEPRELFKDPKTGDGIKKSAKGLIRVEEENGTFVLYDQQTPQQEASGALQTIFLNGKLTRETTIAEIRARVGFIK